MKDKETKAASSVDKYTRLGSDELLSGNLERATEYFETALKRSKHADDGFTSRVCAFNLGAVYIARRDASKGLELLQQAVPPANTKDGRSNGDLFYNFGLAFEIQNNSPEAVKFLELALEEYQSERDNVQMVAEVSMKLGMLYLNVGSKLQAARCHATAAASFHKIQDFGQQTLCLCQQGSALVQANKIEDALEVTDNCMIMCQRVKDLNTLGRVYNELGLIYTQCRDFPKAATCFELALPLSRTPGCDKKRQAVIMQNLGAVYNSLGDFQRSLTLHESAGNLHVELGNRGAQGQCFTNLAYANSQLGDNDAAGEAYLHALQAAKDINDLHAQWQAAEGLGAVSFHQVNVEKAIKYYKQALSTLALSKEKNPAAQERIVAKLTDALEFQVNKDVKPPSGKSVPPRRNGTVDPSPNIMVNSLPRPPTRDEEREIALMREARNERRRGYNRSKVPSEFEKIALGVGVYDSDSDHSMRRDRRASSRNGVRRSSSLRSRPRSAHDTTDLRRSTSARRDRDVRNTASEGDEIRPLPPPRRRSSTRRITPRASSSQLQTGRRQGMQPLLREEDHDSEEEWRENMKKGRGHDYSSESGTRGRVQRYFERGKKKVLSKFGEYEIFRDIYSKGSKALKRFNAPMLQQYFSGDELEYKERLRPPSTPEDDASSGGSNDRRLSRKSRKQSDRLKGIPISPKQPGSQSESETSPEQEDLIKREEERPTGSPPPRPGPKRPTTAKRERINTDQTLTDQEAYLEHLNQMDQEETEESESGSATETEDDDVDDEREKEEMMPRTMPAQSPPPPPGAPPPRPLINTYETPAPVSPGGLPQEEGGGGKDFPYKPGHNYFRMASKPEMEVPPEEDSEEEPKPGPSKVSVPYEEEPLYMTIRSVKNSTVRPQREKEEESEDEPPEPPPMRQFSQTPEFESLSRSEQLRLAKERERILAEYQRTRDENNREKLGRVEDEDPEIALPRKGKTGKNQTSKMCVVM